MKLFFCGGADEKGYILLSVTKNKAQEDYNFGLIP